MNRQFLGWQRRQRHEYLDDVGPGDCFWEEQSDQVHELDIVNRGINLPVGNYNTMSLQQVSNVLLECRRSLFSFHVIALCVSEAGEQVCEGHGDSCFSW